MAYLRDRVFVLRTEPFREHDLWVTYLGRRLGKGTAVARGVRRSHAKHLGHLEPLSECEVMIAKGSAFDKIAVARRLLPYSRNYLPMLVVVSTFANFVDQLLRPGMGDHEPLFTLMGEAMALSDRGKAEITPERARLCLAIATLKALRILGFAPDMTRCALCRADLVSRVAFLPSAHGYVCGACGQKHALTAVWLPRDGMKVIRFLEGQSLVRTLDMSAPGRFFDDVSTSIERLTQEAPLMGPFHGPATILSILT